MYHLFDTWSHDKIMVKRKNYGGGIMLALPVSFFENLKTQKNAKIEKDEVIPFRFSKEVLEGERKIKVEKAVI